MRLTLTVKRLLLKAKTLGFVKELSRSGRLANYDWMVPVLVAMACCRMGMGKKICNMMLDTMENMEHRFQTAHGILVATYWTSKLYKVFGTGQGSGGFPSFWLAVYDVMFKCIDKDLKGVTFVNPAWLITSARVEDAFVDNMSIKVDNKSGCLVEVLKKNRRYMRSIYTPQEENLRCTSVSGH